ncbi:MAG: lysophospholipid acyltransferase family protein [Tannerellaceae bacterium]|jgi:KDO2-lipid IV(A) lauroyltransferase|nr:lysophospholipid acyltransferase family protein [Tannerellaceae bacterium]
MWNKLLYGILYVWVKAHALLPLSILYILSDMLYLLVYRVMRYRLGVVRRNMKASFPEKGEAELRRLERAFYHHFTDYIVETIKLAHISEEEILRRAKLKNPELLEELAAAGEASCVVMCMGHYGNWEWFTSSSLLFSQTRLYQIYRPLKNKAFDRLFSFLRTRFGSDGIKKNDTIRDIVRLNREKIRSVIVFVADQTPSKANLHYWTTFLNQESAILTGPERIARKLNLPVVFLDMEKVKRGYYTVEAKLITKDARSTPDFWLTEQYARMMEQCILRNPAYWLWTHKRWKHKKQSIKN